jgi:UDP-MurNAc hydroxylase
VGQDDPVRVPLISSTGHAGLRVEATDLRLLCDPWMSPGGAFLGTWFPFPDNSHLRAVPGLLDAEWVAVSDSRQDHMDLEFLAGLDDTVRVVIPAYPSSVFRDRLTAAGVKNVVELSAWERLPLNARGDWLTVIPEQSPMAHRAAFLIVADGVSVLHGNDAQLSLAQARRAMIEVGGPLDLMALQVPESRFRAVARLVRSAKPRLVMPYSGPCVLDPALAQYNTPLPGDLPAETLALYPGDSVHIGPTSHEVFRDPRWESFAYNDSLAVSNHLEAYAASRAAEIAQVWAAHPDPVAGSGLAERFESHFVQLGALNPYFLERIGLTVRFELAGADGGTWDVRLGPDGVAVDLEPRDRSDDAVQYTFTVEARWLDAVLQGSIGWEDLLLSQRFQTMRGPDISDAYLLGLLKLANASALRAVENYEQRDPDTTVTLRYGDRTFEVTRYCPHSGEDLAEGAVIEEAPEGPVLRCLAHNFDFSLTTGVCLNARCEPIRVAAPV